MTSYQMILKNILSCRTRDQLETCRNWMLRAGDADPRLRLSEPELRKLSYLLDVLIKPNYSEEVSRTAIPKTREEMREPFKWQSEELVV